MIDLKALDAIGKKISEILQLERLERLTKLHPSIGVMYASLICDINFVLLCPNEIHMGEIDIFGWKIGGQTFQPDIMGKLAAIAAAFEIRAHQMSMLVDAKNIGEFNKGMEPLYDIFGNLLARLGPTAAAKTPARPQQTKASAKKASPKWDHSPEV